MDNIFDKTYIRSSDMDPRLSGYGSNWPRRVVALYPRYYGLEFTYNFGAAARYAMRRPFTVTVFCSQGNKGFNQSGFSYIDLLCVSRTRSMTKPRTQ